MKQEQTSGQKGDKNQPSKKPMSDFLLGLIMFIVFIIFMALWLHFNLPESDKQQVSNLSHANQLELTTASLDANSLMTHTALGRAQRIISF
jgi:dolichyl-phosphate-mannose--protein O-mannosyl transferase